MDRNPFQPADAPVILPRGPHRLERETVLASQRGRLLSAFVALAAERGAHAVSISDIVRTAGTAKRTFYEHFTDKEDAFLQAFTVGSELVFAAVAEVADSVEEPVARIEIATRAYLTALADVGDFTRLFLMQMRGGGEQLAGRWIDWEEALAESMVRWREDIRGRRPDVPPLSRLQAIAAVAAVNEIASITLHRHGLEGLPAVADELAAMSVTLLGLDGLRDAASARAAS